MRIVWILLFFAPAGCDSRPSAPSPDPSSPLRVFAASSLREVVTAIAAEWTKRTAQRVHLQFEASSTLARQIREGAPSDLFITAAPEWLDQVKTIGRIDWLSNRLVVVVRKETGEFDLAKAGSLALANEQVPAGKYARAALAFLGIKAPERTIYGANVRDVLSKVSQGGAQAGIVYATDAAIDPEVRISFTFPPESHPRIFYSLGLLAPSAKGLYDALQEPWAMAMTRKHGFSEVR